MRLYILYDDRRIEKYPLLMNELAQQGITDYELVPAIIDMRSVVESINAGHKGIVRMAKETRMPYVCIAEDDLMFTSPNSWEYFLNTMPKEFDLHLWGTYIMPLSNNCVCGFQLYIVSEKFYDKFLSVPDDAHIDTAMDDLKGDYHFCYPFPALQRSGFSANNPGQPVNYNNLLKEEDIYKG